jgi:hypothetical protein
MEVDPMVASARVLVGEVREGKEGLSLGAHHAVRYPSAELEDLSANVAEERVGGLTPDQHDGKNGDASKVHSHGAPRMDGVCADFQMGETENVGADAFCCGLQLTGQET